jgi:transcriptional regulator with XRE-family HTH domain
MIVAQRIEKVLSKRHLSQAELEQLAGLAKGRVSKWASGQGEPTARQALRIARVLGVPVEWLADDTAPGEPPEPAPAPPPPLSEDERYVLEVFRALEITRADAIRRLAGPPVYAEPHGDVKRSRPGNTA